MSELELRVESFKKSLPCFVRIRKDKLSYAEKLDLDVLSLFVATEVKIVNKFVYLRLLNKKNLYYSDIFEMIENWIPN